MFGFNKHDIGIVYYLFKMTIRDKYLGTKFGVAWGILNPLLLLGIYVFVFGFVLKSKIPGSDKSIDFVIWLISGYAPWLAISEGIVSSSNSIVSGVSLVKNIVFKTELLPIASVFTGLVPFTVGVIVLLSLIIASGGGLHLSIFWICLVLPLHFAFLISLGLFLSTITVFVRDLSQILSSALMLILFFTPIFYSIDQMPYIIQKVTFYNPFYQIVKFYRDILVVGINPDFVGILYVFILALILLIVGLKFFRKLKGYFVSYL